MRSAFLAGTAALALVVAMGSAYGWWILAYADSHRNVVARTDFPGVKSGEVKLIGRSCHPDCNYLVLGNDSRAGLSKEEQRYFGTNRTVPGRRSDTIMVVHVDPRQRRAVILSFPRDLWVRIPGVGMGKIASAYEGGPYKVAHVVHDLTGLRINHFLSVNLAGFERVVDAVGSVPLCVAGPLVDPLSGLNLPRAGCYDLDGRQALAFVRARHVCGEGGIPDFNRISRQQQFLRAVLSRALSLRMITRARELVDGVFGNLLVDRGLHPADVLYLANVMKGISNGSVDFRVVPAATGYAQTEAGTVDVVRMTPQARKLFRRLRDGKPLRNLGRTQLLTPPSPAVVRTRVYDASSGGKAGKLYRYLSQAGFDTVGTAVGSLGQAGAAILYRPGADAEAAVVRQYLPELPVHEARRGTLDVDVAVVVDSTYAGVGLRPAAPGPTPTGGPPPSGCPS